MRICIDLDGTICETRQEGFAYWQVKPLPGVIEKLQQFHIDGHYIIIATSRHMKTCNNNVGQVVARVGFDTIEWLRTFGVPYDEIWFGKPLADLYIDDKSFNPTKEDWNTLKLVQESEEQQ